MDLKGKYIMVEILQTTVTGLPYEKGDTCKNLPNKQSLLNKHGHNMKCLLCVSLTYAYATLCLINICICHTVSHYHMHMPHCVSLTYA